LIKPKVHIGGKKTKIIDRESVVVISFLVSSPVLDLSGKKVTKKNKLGTYSGSFSFSKFCSTILFIKRNMVEKLQRNDSGSCNHS
jgi:hypothetical protein